MDLSDAHKTVDNDTIKRIVAEHGPHIRSIRLANCWGVTDTGVRAIAEHCPNLTIVSLQSCWYAVSQCYLHSSFPSARNASVLRSSNPFCRR